MYNLEATNNIALLQKECKYKQIASLRAQVIIK